MKLEQIKNCKDEYCTQFTFNLIKILKKECNLPNNVRLFCLSYRNLVYYFFYKNIVFAVSGITVENKKEIKNIDCIYKIILLKNTPISVDDIEVEVVKSNSDNKYSLENFLDFLNSPSNITEDIDLPYYKIIYLFHQINRTRFEYGDFVFYIKRDNDYSLYLNLYAKNKKNNNIVKLYLPYIWERDEKTFLFYKKIPTNLRKIYVDDFSKNLSDYQKRKFKTSLLKFIQEENKFFNIKNFYVIYLIKQIIQPVEFDTVWMTHRIFRSCSEFSNIWVDDFLSYGNKPYFLIANSSNVYDITKIAIIDFKEPKYVTKDIYKQNLIKFLHWELSKDYLKKLVEFLKQPYNGLDSLSIKNGVKTNWQKLIFEYNFNTVLACDLENKNAILGYEILPLDLPIPDYTKLLN